MKRLRLANFGLNSYQAIKAYLQNRTVIVKYGNEMVQRNISKGCPQGSVLGPALWNVAYDLVLRDQYLEGVRIIAFAKDTAVLVEADTAKHLRDKFEASMVKIRRMGLKS